MSAGRDFRAVEPDRTHGSNWGYGRDRPYRPYRADGANGCDRGSDRTNRTDRADWPDGSGRLPGNFTEGI